MNKVILEWLRRVSFVTQRNVKCLQCYLFERQNDSRQSRRERLSFYFHLFFLNTFFIAWRSAASQQGRDRPNPRDRNSSWVWAQGAKCLGCDVLPAACASAGSRIRSGDRIQTSDHSYGNPRSGLDTVPQCLPLNVLFCFSYVEQQFMVPNHCIRVSEEQHIQSWILKRVTKSFRNWPFALCACHSSDSSAFKIQKTIIKLNEICKL